MQLVHSCGLLKELVMPQGCCRRVGCEELADDVLVLPQLKSGLGHPGAEIQDLPPGAALHSHLAN